MRSGPRQELVRRSLLLGAKELLGAYFSGDSRVCEAGGEYSAGAGAAGSRFRLSLKALMFPGWRSCRALLRPAQDALEPRQSCIAALVDEGQVGPVRYFAIVGKRDGSRGLI